MKILQWTRERGGHGDHCATGEGWMGTWGLNLFFYVLHVHLQVPKEIYIFFFLLEKPNKAQS